MSYSKENLEFKVKILGICVVLLILALLYVTYLGSRTYDDCSNFWINQIEEIEKKGFCNFNIINNYSLDELYINVSQIKNNSQD
jgi:hypothetical protein